MSKSTISTFRLFEMFPDESSARGMFKDSPSNLRSAADYLEKSTASTKIPKITVATLQRLLHSNDARRL